MTHEEFRKLKLYYYGNKIFKIDENTIRIRNKIKELKKRNGVKKENPLS